MVDQPIEVIDPNKVEEKEIKVDLTTVEVTDPSQDTGSGENTSFQDRVHELAEEIEFDSTKQDYVVPKGYTKDEIYAAKLLKNNLNSLHYKAEMTIKEKKLLENQQTLLEEIAGNTAITISAGDQAELDELKFSDPEKWRKKLNQLENDARKVALAGVTDKLNHSPEDLDFKTSVEYRQILLNQYNQENPKHQITDEIVRNELPQNLVEELSSGKISFPSWIKKVSAFRKQGKVIQRDIPIIQPNLSKQGGGVVTPKINAPVYGSVTI